MKIQQKINQKENRKQYIGKLVLLSFLTLERRLCLATQLIECKQRNFHK